MNISYRVIWNATLGKWVVASELAKANGKSASRQKRALSLSVAASLLALPMQFAMAQTSEVADTAAPTCASQELNQTAECTAQLTGGNAAFGGFAGASLAVPTAAAMLDDTYVKVNAVGGGSAASNTATGSIAIGASSSSVGNGDIAIGQSAYANGNAINATALGTFASAQGQGATALGGRASAVGDRSVAIGRYSASNAVDSTAIGGYATVTAGSTNSIALGANAVADRSNVISVGAAGSERSIINVAQGAADTDAVNMSQLNATNARVGATESSMANLDTRVVDTESKVGTLQGDVSGLDTRLGSAEGALSTAQGNIGALQGSVSNLDGRMTLNEGTITNLQTNISNVTTQLNSGSVGPVQQAGAGSKLTVGAALDGDVVDFTGTAGARQLTGVKDGSADSDAVNMSQLNETNANVTAANTAISGLGSRMTTAEGSIGLLTSDLSVLNGVVQTHDTNITNLQATVDTMTSDLSSGAIGLVQQANAGNKLTVGRDIDGDAVDFADKDGKTRSLKNVTAGSDDTDAVNVSQLRASGLLDASGAPQVALTYDSPSFASMTLRGANGTVINNVAAGEIAQGSMQAVNGGQLHTLQQGLQTQVDQLGSNVASLGSSVQTQIDQLNSSYVTLGDTVQSQYSQLNANINTLTNNVQSQFDAAGDLAGALNSRLSSMEEDLAGGKLGGAGSGEGSAQLGLGADASGSNSTAVGEGAKASGSESMAMGSGAAATGNQSTAMGNGAVASASGSTALGNGASATADNVVALGAGSVADRANTVSVGSVGNERQITNVAAGTQRTDAANWGQVQDAVGGVQDWANNKFNEVNRRTNAVGAMGAAYGQMTFSAQGINTANKVGVGVGSMNGKNAIAVGYSRQLAPNVNVSFGGSASGNDASVGAGMSMGW
ncbi:ESPR-type extended signal peptide-containing protein [Dyella sp. ASV21]|uniref:ESPR-type extended signal peptide-containing protein n=1 Tax=Dyella sp. ASV21 TaxID=2795114 RepID=UPI0018ED3F9C|nr:ESPR-type extended signal peptide-containing protein [Dyella sp. ASV21]